MKGDLLIKNARVWPSADSDVIEQGSVLVKGGHIARVGQFRARADVEIDADGDVLMPGLIQTHIHLCQTLFRGAAEDLPLLPWLRNYIWPMEAAHDADSIRASALLAAAELIRGGTTAFMSMETVRHTQAAFEAISTTGLMGVIGHCLMDESSGYEPLATDVTESLETCDALLDYWEGEENLRLGVAPRFALSCTGENMKLAADYARDRGLIIHTHSSEQLPEVALVRERTGMPNIEYLDSLGLSGPDVCLAHCIHTEPHERELLRDTDTRVLHCPSANLKLGSGIAPIPEYLEMGINVSIGADGAPCNNRLDAFLEMRHAGLIQKPRLGADAFPSREVVRLATSAGAEALGWGEEMGTLEEGKRANMILIDPSSFHVLPSDDVAANVVYGHVASDVEMTIINGEIVYEDGQINTIDEEKLREDVIEQRAFLMARADLA